MANFNVDNANDFEEPKANAPLIKQQRQDEADLKRLKEMLPMQDSDEVKEPKQEGEVVRFRVWDKVNNCESRNPHYIGSDGTLYTDCDPHGVDMSGKRTIRVNTNYELLTPAEPKEDIEFFKTSTPRPKMTNEDTRKRITNIIRENITFSGQIGDYIIHGAIEKLCDLIDENNRAWRDFHEQAEPKEEQTELLLAFKKWYDSKNLFTVNKRR